MRDYLRTYGRTQNLSSLFIEAIVTQVQHFKILVCLQWKEDKKKMKT